MSRYIDADALIGRLDYCVKEGMGSTIAFTFKHMVEDAPSIDIEPKHGEWIGYNADKGDDWLRSDGEPIFLVCNKCYGTVMNNTSAHWNFCPNCGARMKGADDETD